MESPPHMIISEPSQIAVWLILGTGVDASVLVGNHESVAGAYRPPELRSPPALGAKPPQTTMRLPVQTAEASSRGPGTPAPIEVGLQVLDAGSKRPPVFK